MNDHDQDVHLETVFLILQGTRDQTAEELRQTIENLVLYIDAVMNSAPAGTRHLRAVYALITGLGGLGGAAAALGQRLGQPAAAAATAAGAVAVAGTAAGVIYAGVGDSHSDASPEVPAPRISRRVQTPQEPAPGRRPSPPLRSVPTQQPAPGRGTHQPGVASAPAGPTAAARPSTSPSPAATRTATAPASPWPRPVVTTVPPSLPPVSPSPPDQHMTCLRLHVLVDVGLCVA